MSLIKHRTSNPAFSGGIWRGYKYSRSKMSLNGILLKSLFSIFLVGATTWYVWNLVEQGVNVRWYTSGGLLVALFFSLLTSFKKHWAWFTVPLYSLAKGMFLGGFSGLVEKQFEGLPMQAVGITITTFFIMLFLYKTRIIVVTRKLRGVIISAASTIFTLYIISWILSFFGIHVPFIWGTSWFAISFTFIAACVAAFSLLLDFDYIDRKTGRAPKYMEWVATWGLLVSLIWLYVEILRFLKKMAFKF